MRPNPLDYKPLFRVEGIYTCLGTEQFLNGSLGIGLPLCISSNGVWHSFIDKDKERLCLKKGLEIFSSPEQSAAYFTSFEEYINHVQKEVIPKYSLIPERITKEEFIELLPVIEKLDYYYGITEFSYHDLAYEVSKKVQNALLDENLNRLGRIKFKGREILNAYLHLDGVIPNILRRLSRDYLGDEDSAFYLFTDELFELFDGKKPTKEVIAQRKKCHALGKFDEGITRFSFEESLALAKLFTSESQKETVTGTIACAGKAVGKVVIAPMLNDPQRISDVIKKMNKGDVLVAHSTTPELLPLCHKAVAIVADQGGMLSHAAIMSRELGLPCVIGTGDATLVFKDGDIVEVDADNGIVRKIEL